MFFRQLLANRIGGFFGMDVLVSAAAMLVFTRRESSRVGGESGRRRTRFRCEAEHQGESRGRVTGKPPIKPLGKSCRRLDRKRSLTSSAYLFYIAKQMKHGELLGSLEHIILLALSRLDRGAHGMIVRREIEERTGRNISIGAVYATLERLEAKGYVSSFTGEPTPERGGRAKRLFRVEAAGKRALQVSEQTLRSMTAGLESRWEGI